MGEFFHLLWGTFVNRPYVDGFFACFLVFCPLLFGIRRAALYFSLAFAIALLCELSSTRWGFPFGMYVYIDTMRTRELWISNVPSWDALSFVFLSFASWVLAGTLRARTLRSSEVAASLRSGKTMLLGGLLMMCLDIVIDPLTLKGDQWFLGKIYYYPEPGPYFGVTIANFLGWWIVGALIPLLYVRLFKLSLREVPKLYYWGVFGVYAGVLLFILSVTIYIREWALLAASLGVTLAVLTPTAATLKRRSQAHGA